MKATTARKLAEITAAGEAGLLVKTGLTAGIRELSAAGVITVKCVNAARGPNGCGWYMVRLAP